MHELPKILGQSTCGWLDGHQLSCKWWNNHSPIMWPSRRPSTCFILVVLVIGSHVDHHAIIHLTMWTTKWTSISIFWDSMVLCTKLNVLTICIQMTKWMSNSSRLISKDYTSFIKERRVLNYYSIIFWALGNILSALRVKPAFYF